LAIHLTFFDIRNPVPFAYINQIALYKQEYEYNIKRY
jgi:hypothetical protein